MMITYRIIDAAFEIINIMIIIRVILSWLQPTISDARWRKAINLIYKFTEPILEPIRRILPTGSIGIDFSPLVAIFALSIIRNFIFSILF